MNEIKNFFYDYLSLLTGRFSTILFSIITFTMVIRLLNPEQFGIFNLFLLVIQIGLLFSANWTTSAMIRFGKEEVISDGTITKTFWARALILSITLPVFLFVMLTFRNKIANYIGLPSSHIHLVIVYFITLSIFSLLLYPYQALGRMKAFSFIPAFEKMIYCLLLSLLYLKVFPRKASSVIIFIIFASIFSNLLLFILFEKKIIIPIKISITTLKKIFHFSWPALFGGASGYVVNWIDIIVIKMYLTVFSVGVYSVAYGIYNYLMTAPLLWVNLVSLMLTGFLVRKREDLIIRYVKRLIPQLIFFWSLFVSLIMVLSEPIFSIWVGKKYELAVYPFIILTAGLVFRGITCAYTPLYSVYLMPKRYHITNIFIALINLMGDFILIPHYGIIGAAISTTGAFFISSLIFLIMANYKLKIVNFSPIFCSIPVVACFIISLLVDNSVARLVFFGLIFLISIVIARRYQLFKKEDITMLEPVKMPSIFKKVITKVVYVLSS